MSLRSIKISPWTLLGLLISWATRCKRRYYGDPRERTYLGESWPWPWLRKQGLGGVTLGEVIVFTDNPTGALLRHERAHVAQARRLGWRYGFAYAWGCVVGLAKAIHEHHPMEKEARDAE